MRENLFSKGKWMYTNSKSQGEKLIWPEWELKVQVVVFKLIYNVLRRKCKTIKNGIIYISRMNNTEREILNLLKNCLNTNENAPIFNKKLMLYINVIK